MDTEVMLCQFRDELEAALGGNFEEVFVYSSGSGEETDLGALVVLKEAGRHQRATIHKITYQLMWDRDFKPMLYLNIIEHKRYMMLLESGSEHLNRILQNAKRLGTKAEEKEGQSARAH